MKRRFFFINLILLFTPLVVAAEASAVEFHFGGFGTGSFSTFNNTKADYVLNDQPEGPGRTRSSDIGLDSSLGVQFDLGLNKSLDLGLQIVADRNPDRTVTPEVTVAQMRWRLSPALTVRLGKMPIGAFLNAETRKVRFTMPWVRPPLEVYSLVPTSSRDGVDIIHEGKLGCWFSELHGGLVRSRFDVPLSNSREM